MSHAQLMCLRMAPAVRFFRPISPQGTKCKIKLITKRGNVHCDWFIHRLLLRTPTTWISLDLLKLINNS